MNLKRFYISILYSLCLLFTQRSLAQTDTLIQLVDIFAVKDTTAKITFKIPLADTLINYAYKFMGKNYSRGGVGNKGFDCSGFTMTVFAHFNVKLPHTSAGQALVGVEVKKNQLKKGDLLFFRGRSRKSRRIGHVGIVISEKDEPIRFIHSSSSEGVRLDRLEAPYYKLRFIKASRVLPYR